GGGTRATNPGSEVTREGVMRTGGGFTRFLEEFRDHRCIVNPALSDLVEDWTQSGTCCESSSVNTDKMPQAAHETKNILTTYFILILLLICLWLLYSG
ncbi:unnamed protein product, partial [Heterotrigona itama]